MWYHFVASWSRLVLAARSLPELERVAKECRALGSEAIAVKTDVGVEDDCKYVSAESSVLCKIVATFMLCCMFLNLLVQKAYGNCDGCV
mgnify:CR=1 FL=1